MAAQSYHDINKRFPVGIRIPYAIEGNDPLTGGMGNPFGPNWAVFMLPHFEQDNLFQQARTLEYPNTTNVMDIPTRGALFDGEHEYFEWG